MVRERRVLAGHAGAFVVVALALGVGCTQAGRVGESVVFALNPFAGTDVTVMTSEQHGPYLFVGVHSAELQERFVVPASAACARVLAAEARVGYQKRGHFGRFVGGNESCDAVGTLSLAARREPRGARAGSVVPRTTARFALAHRDDRYILLRGRFALASRVGVPATFDVVAVLPDDEPCREVASRREASLEFRHAGPEPFRLLGAGPGCVVSGFAMPVEDPPRAPLDQGETGAGEPTVSAAPSAERIASTSRSPFSMVAT